MRDHPYHRIPFGNNTLGILAGMWGIKGKTIKIHDMINNYIQNKFFQKRETDKVVSLFLFEVIFTNYLFMK